MAYQPDLTFHTYSQGGIGPVLAVGWLENGQAFPQGQVSPAVFNQLAAWVADPHTYGVNFMRGWHDPDLPHRDNPSRSWYRDAAYAQPAQYPMANGELWIEHAGIIYAAPMMVFEYVRAYGYQPPEAFQAAVVHGSCLRQADLEARRFPAPPSGEVPADPEAQRAAQAQCQEAAQQLHDQAYQRATDLIDAVLAQYPSYAHAWFIRLNVQIGMADYDAAAATLQRLLPLAPNLPEVYGTRGMLHVHRREWEQAIRWLQLVLPTFQHRGGRNHHEILRYLVWAEQGRGDLARSLSFLNELCAQVPPDRQTRRLRRRLRGQRFRQRLGGWLRG